MSTIIIIVVIVVIIIIIIIIIKIIIIIISGRYPLGQAERHGPPGDSGAYKYHLLKLFCSPAPACNDNDNDNDNNNNTILLAMHDDDGRPCNVQARADAGDVLVMVAWFVTVHGAFLVHKNSIR